jgi:hypothetical protein
VESKNLPCTHRASIQTDKSTKIKYIAGFKKYLREIEDLDMNPHSYTHPKHTMEKRQPFQQMLLGKVGICRQKTETRSMFITLCKYQLKVDKGP